MPANRSRTAGWRQCLEQIKRRGGSIELAIARPEIDGSAVSGDLLVRCRVLSIDDEAIRVEAPVALGRTIEIPKGVELVAMMAVGQNRWMFRTHSLQWHSCAGRMDARAEIELAVPNRVERCQRRRDYRVETASLDLPSVQLWPLLDPSTVVLAERVNEAAFLRELDGMDSPLCRLGDGEVDDEILPEVGPSFPARLVNLGGGGVGLTVEDSYAGSLGRKSLFWMRFGLPPMLTTPVCATARLVHSHMQSDRQTYAGMTFDFSANPAHKRVVVRQILQAIACQQKLQMSRQAS
ncbi:MAG: hypothetical protein CMJ40_00305 [Phycisphaerae bacterium]|nr:hypothetical protein [Phycisphaerae bacterium]